MWNINACIEYLFKHYIVERSEWLHNVIRIYLAFEGIRIYKIFIQNEMCVAINLHVMGKSISRYIIELKKAKNCAEMCFACNVCIYVQCIVATRENISLHNVKFEFCAIVRSRARSIVYTVFWCCCCYYAQRLGADNWKCLWLYV